MLIRSFLCAFLLSGVALAQDATTFTTGIKEVLAPTLVTDRHGQSVDGLKTHEFHLTDNGKPQDIKVGVTAVPISLVVAIQANSVAEPVLPKIRKIGPLLQGLVTGDQGEVAILAFDHRIQMLQDFTNDTAKIEAGLAKLRPGSKTSSLNDAVVAAVRMLKTRPENRHRVLLLISEVRDYGSEAKVRDALTDLQLGNVSVYSVNINEVVNALRQKEEDPRPNPIPDTAYHMPAGVPPTPENVRQLYGNPMNSADVAPLIADIFRATKSIFVESPVQVYTKFTGGDEHAFVSQASLESAIGQIGDELHALYLISYVPSNRSEGGFHDIVVTVDRAGLKIRTRPGYWVAPQN